MHPTRADVDLLWAAAALPPDGATIRHAQHAADIGLVCETASRHRILNLVVGTLDAPVPERFTKQSRMLRARANLTIPAAAHLAIRPLDDVGLTPLVLKGLSLAERYPSIELRPMDDIDLLLPRASIDAATTTLQRAGWRRAHHRDRDPHYDVAFRHPDAPGVPLELHFDLARWAERAPSLGGADLWDARVERTVYGHTVWALPPEVEFAFLVFHAARAFHVFRRLLWIVDLVVLDRTHELDWDEIARRATAIHRRVALACALRLAERLGAAPPEALLRVPPALERSGVLDELLDRAEPFSTSFRPRWMAYAMLDGSMSKLRHAVGDLTRPSGRTSRRIVMRDLAGMGLRGIPRYVRAGLNR